MPDAWPSLRDVLAYRDRIRAEILASLDDVGDAPATNVMAENGRVLLMALEHEQMHQETLLYMVQRLPLSRIARPALTPIYAMGDALRARPFEVDEGYATLGANFDDLDFGWDNEFPRSTVAVPRFKPTSTIWRRIATRSCSLEVCGRSLASGIAADSGSWRSTRETKP